MPRSPTPAPGWTLRHTALLLAAIAIIGMLAYRSHAERQATLRDSAARAEAANAAAEQRRLDSQRRREASARSAASGDDYFSPGAAGSASSAGDTEIHQCSYAGKTASRLGPCQAPWVELSAAEPASTPAPAPAPAPAGQSVLDQAEWRLRAEQDRFAALTAQGQSAATSNQASATPSRCAQAKAARDAAYLKMGNSRNFNSTRQWTDFVYANCKSP